MFRYVMQIMMPLDASSAMNLYTISEEPNYWLGYNDNNRDSYKDPNNAGAFAKQRALGLSSRSA
jgi:hypothetical protein